jgi:glycosyltransferase involved in cell wall biosynthesis
MLVKNTFTHDARVLREAIALSEIGYEVHVICLQGLDLPVHEVALSNINIHRVISGPFQKTRRLADPSSSFDLLQVNPLSRMGKRFLKILRFISRTFVFEIFQKYIDSKLISKALEINPNIIHAHDFDTLASAVKTSNLLGIPLIYDSHELAAGRNLAATARNKKIFKREAFLIKSADWVIMASEGYAKFAEKHYGVVKPTVLLNVPNFVETFKGDLNLRKLININASDFLLLYQGNIQPNRGIEQAIESLMEIENVSLVIVGYGDFRFHLIELVKKHRLDQRVHFYGPVPPEDLIHIAHFADAGLCNIVGTSESYKHSMPNKLFEYAMSEIPIIASNYEGMGGFVLDHKIGVVCDPLDPTSIAAAISELRNNESLTQAFKENCRGVKEIYCWEIEKQKLVQLYSQLKLSLPE